MIYKTTNQIKLNYSYKHLSEDGLLKKHPLKRAKIIIQINKTILISFIYIGFLSLI